MKAKTLILCMLLPYLSNAEAQIRQSFQVQDYRIEKVDGYDKIISEGAELRAQKVGYPELPSYKKTFLVPRNASNIHLNIQNVKKKKVAGTYLIYPTQEIISVGDDGNQTWIDPQEEIYSSALAYPGEYGKILSDYFYLGYRLVDVLLFPFEYNPAKGELYLCNIDFSIDYKEFNENSEVDFPILNQSDYITNLNRKAIKSIVANPQLANSYDLNIKNMAQGDGIWRQSTTSEVSSLNAPMPEYIIITVDSLKESFYPFAEWKTKKGIYTIIQSTEKIEYTRPCFSERVTSNVVWTESRSICGDLDIYPESSLTVEGCTIDFGSASTLTIHEGASLEIDGATLQGISVDAKPGSSFKLHGGGVIHLREGGLFETGKGTTVEMGHGEIGHLPQ